MIWLLVLAFLASLSASAPVAAQAVGGPGGNPNNPIAPNQPCPDDSNRVANTHFVHTCGGGGGGGGSIPLGLGFTITPGQDNPAAGTLATPLVVGTNTLYGQIDPLPFFVDTPITAAMMGHNIKAMAGVSILFTLPAAGSVGAEKGVSVCFVAQGAGGLTLTADSPSLLQGVPVSVNVMTSPQYGNGCAASDGTDWDVSWAFPGGGGGVGTVTSIASGSHITLTPDPITVTGTVAFSQMATNTIVANPTSGTANAQDLAVPSCSADHEALQWTTNTGFGCPSDYAQFDKNQTWTKNQAMGPVILIDGATIATNGLDRNYFKVTLTGNNHTLANPSNLQPGNYTWYIYQDGSGGHTGFSTDTGFLWVGGTPTWTTTAGAEDVISCLVDDTLQMACFAGLDVGGAGGTLALTSAHLFVGNASNRATDVPVSGVLTLANTGVFSFASSTGSGSVVLATAPSVSSLTVTTAFTATGLVTNADLVNPSTTVNGQTCTLGSTCTVTASATSITVGSTTIGSGSTGRVLYDNGGTLGEMTTSGSGTVLALATGPSISALTVTSSFTATGLVTAADLFGTTGSGGNVVLATGPSISALTVTSSFTATGLVTNADLVSPSTTVNGQTCTLGSSCTVTAAATSLTVGTTTIASGTTGRLLFDNAGTLGEPTITAASASGALTLGSTTGPVAGSVTMWGSTSGSLQVKPAAAAGTSSVLTLPGGTTDFSATGGTNQLVKQATSGGAFTVGTIACAGLSDGATGCSTATGTSGATIPLLNVANTWSAIQTFGNGQITPNNAVVATLLATGTSVSLTAPRQYYVCTGTCTVTPPVPAAGYEFCVMNDDNVATAITLAALGSSARYENTARTAYGTAGTGTLVSTAVVGSKVCILGLDSTHYLTTTYTGSWTAS